MPFSLWFGGQQGQQLCEDHELYSEFEAGELTGLEAHPSTSMVDQLLSVLGSAANNSHAWRRHSNGYLFWGLVIHPILAVGALLGLKLSQN